MLSAVTPDIPNTRKRQPPTTAPTTPRAMSRINPSPVLLTSLLPMKPAIRPSTTHATIDMVGSPLPRCCAVVSGDSPSCSVMLKGLRNGSEKVIDLDRLALVRVEPGAHHPPPVLTHHRRGHGYDGNLPSGRFRAELPKRLHPVDAGEPNVHQDQVRASLLGEADAGFSRLGLDGGVPLERQHAPDELPVLVVVLNDQDQLAGHGRTGSVKVNVEPTPTWLVTQIRPPCSSMNYRERASPSPVPSAFLSAVPTCRNSSKTASWSSGAIPNPVSVTETSTIPSVDAARTSIRPPSGVNLIAFERRFKRTCLTLRSSDRMAATRSSMAW